MAGACQRHGPRGSAAQQPECTNASVPVKENRVNQNKQWGVTRGFLHLQMVLIVDGVDREMWIQCTDESGNSLI